MANTKHNTHRVRCTVNVVYNVRRVISMWGVCFMGCLLSRSYKSNTRSRGRQVNCQWAVSVVWVVWSERCGVRGVVWEVRWHVTRGTTISTRNVEAVARYLDTDRLFLFLNLTKTNDTKPKSRNKSGVIWINLNICNL